MKIYRTKVFKEGTPLFEPKELKNTKIEIQKFLYRTYLCIEAVEEIKTLFKHIEESYANHLQLL